MRQLFVGWCVLFSVVVATIGQAFAIPRAADPSLLEPPPGEWPFVRNGPKGRETYSIPSQLDALRALPEPERSASLRAIGARQANLAYLKRTGERFFPLARRGAIRVVPDYRKNLAKAMMAIDVEQAAADNPIHMHEPVLKALPAYTRVVLLTPPNAESKVLDRLRVLGLDQRVRVVVRRPRTSNDMTLWVRDAFFAAADGRRTVVMMPLSYRNFDDAAKDDLSHLLQADGGEQQAVRVPAFFRGGNLALAEHGRRLLFIGGDENAMNEYGFVNSFGFLPPPQAVPSVLRAAVAADEIVVLPNSRNFYHLDMYMVPLAEGLVGLLEPLDPERLRKDDREVLTRAKEQLRRLGFQIVPIPTKVERIERFQSPANSVVFVHRHSGRRRALVPQFPEPAGQNPAESLNAKALAAYRAAGVEPIPVEDRFHVRWGNTHCALVALR